MKSELKIANAVRKWSKQAKSRRCSLRFLAKSLRVSKSLVYRAAKGNVTLQLKKAVERSVAKKSNLAARDLRNKIVLLETRTLQRICSPVIRRRKASVLAKKESNRSIESAPSSSYAVTSQNIWR